MVWPGDIMCRHWPAAVTSCCDVLSDWWWRLHTQSGFSARKWAYFTKVFQNKTRSSCQVNCTGHCVNRYISIFSIFSLPHQKDDHKGQTMKSSSYCMYHNLSVRRRPLVAVATITTAKEDVRRSSIIGEKSVRRMLRINCAVKQGTKVNGEFFKLTSVVKKLHLHNATRHQVIGTFVLEVAEEKQRFFSPNRDVLLNLTKQFRWLTKLYHGGPVHVSCITLQSCLGDGDIVGEADNPPIQLFMRMRMCCHHKIKALHGTLPVHYKLFFPAAPHTSWVHLCIKERQKYFLKKNLLSCIPSQHVKNMLKKKCVCVCILHH